MVEIKVTEESSIDWSQCKCSFTLDLTKGCRQISLSQGSKNRPILNTFTGVVEPQPPFSVLCVLHLLLDDIIIHRSNWRKICSRWQTSLGLMANAKKATTRCRVPGLSLAEGVYGSVVVIWPQCIGAEVCRIHSSIWPDC